MEAFNECLINTISVLLQPGEIPNLRKATRTCHEFRSLLTPVSGDTRLNQRGAQTQQGSVGSGALPHEWPQHLFTAAEVSLSLPTWKVHAIFHLVVFPLPQGWLFQRSSARFGSMAMPGPVPRGCGRLHAEAGGHGLSHQLNFLPTGQWIFPPVATWDEKLTPL